MYLYKGPGNSKKKRSENFVNSYSVPITKELIDNQPSFFLAIS
jgi:hypothetical protein